MRIEQFEDSKERTEGRDKYDDSLHRSFRPGDREGELSQQESAAGNPYKMDGDIGEGASLSAVLAESRIGESVLMMMVQVGEEQGDLAQALSKACRVYERELREKIKVLTTVLEPVLIIGLGLVVGFIVFSMMLPIIEIDLV